MSTLHYLGIWFFVAVIEGVFLMETFDYIIPWLSLVVWGIMVVRDVRRKLRLWRMR